jgi:hypothetical protein
MKRTLIILFAILLVGIYNDCQAQRLLRNIARRAQNRVEEKVEERIYEEVEEEVDKKVDEALDEAFEEEGDSTATQTRKTRDERDRERAQRIMARMGANSTPVNIEENYAFSANVKMEIETWNNNNLENKDYINSFFTPDNQVFAYEVQNQENSENQKGFFIIDQKNNATIILTEEDGEKNGVVTGIDMDDLQNFAAEEAKKDDTDPADFSKAQKTGRTKKILGYTCEEYVFKGETEESILWISKEKDLKMGNFFSSIYKNSTLVSGYPGGMIMEAETTDRNTNEKSVMRVTEINDDIRKEIDLSAYNIINMGRINIPQETGEE